MLHSGWVKGFVADISYSPRHRTGLAVLLNAESGVLGELGAAFWADTLRADAAATGIAPTGADPNRRTERGYPVLGFARSDAMRTLLRAHGDVDH